MKTNSETRIPLLMTWISSLETLISSQQVRLILAKKLNLMIPFQIMMLVLINSMPRGLFDRISRMTA
jgi:hypothetical protein